ncbi:MAG: hypothetical protein OXU75_00890 [Deltaproteobacteria bacterium]|nr:hypothetical protein [Deltaproteobacteria bacterium]
MRSRFYYEGHHQAVASAVRDYVNSSQDFLSPHTAGSPRAAGDAIEALVAEKFGGFLGDWCTEYSREFARRAMADMAFTDKEGIYSVVDVKTHREDARFSMPNLTSVDRLARFYESDANVFSLLMIKYAIEDTSVTVSEVVFCPIEFLDWSCLTVGALGWGQIQIANSNNIRVIERYSRKEWMLQLCDALLTFYPKEIGKIQDRIERFSDVRKYWEAKEDLWR